MKIQVKLFQALMIVNFAICAATLANAQEEIPNLTIPSKSAPLGRISGRIVLPSGHPVNSRVRVTLSSAETPGITTYTDNNGVFSFSNLHEGIYTLEAAGDPKLYEPVTEQVRLIRSMQLSLTIYLKEKSAPEKRTAEDVVSLAELEMDQKVPIQAKKEFEKATRLVSEGDTQKAIEHYKRAIAIYPKYLMARNDLGVQYLKLKRWTDATEQFETAIEMNPKAFNPRLNLAIVLIEQKKYPQAIDQLVQALLLQSNSPAAHLYLGVASLEVDELDAADRELAKAISLGGPQYSVAHYYLAQAQIKRGDRDAAMRELEIYLEQSPNGEYSASARSLLEKLKSYR
jgi:tetratricopeptide (TPR) repeat protein